MFKVAFLAVFMALAATSIAADKKIVCYFGSWAIYRPGLGKFDISDLDPRLCTHIVYSVVGINIDGSLRVSDSWADLPDGLDGYGKFTRLRQLSPGTKAMIAIGGWNEGSTKFSQVAGDPGTRARFVQNVLNFLKQYNFDGFDVDWEYPNQRGGQPADKQNYVALLRELRQAFNPHGYILSVAVAAAESSASKSYNIRELSQHVHFISLMTFDFNGSWNPNTGLNAPMNASSRESGDQAKLNMDSAVRYWIQQGAPRDKLVLGVPSYGRSFTLADPGKHGLGAPTTGPGAAGPYTRDAGMLGFNEICVNLGQGGWTVIRDPQQQVPYAFKGNQWVGYDDASCVGKKADYIKKMGLAGAMLWSVETDDFRGTCGRKYPLLNALNSILREKVICYYESWAKYRSGDGKYNIKSINAELCTHVLYSFAGIKTDGSVKLLDDASDLTKFTSFVKKHNGVKALLSIGGASEGSKKFSAVVSDSSVRNRFVKNVAAFLEKYHFDGVDIDWEYPNQNGGRKSDKQNYVLLLKELKQAFAGKGLSLSAAVGAEASSASESYVISQIAKYLDFINIMTYDFNGSWNDYAGMNSPLYHSSKDDSFQRTLNINSSVHYWLSHGAPRSKVIVGLPFYGASFTLKNAKHHGLYAKASGPGKAAPHTAEAGTIGYNEMCVYIRDGGWHIVRDEEQRVPYAYKGNQWISYDDVTSIREKAEYVRSMDLGGAMIWSIDTDDFNGDCGAKHVLLSTRINDKMIEQDAQCNQTATIVFSNQWKQ